MNFDDKIKKALGKHSLGKHSLGKPRLGKPLKGNTLKKNKLTNLSITKLKIPVTKKSSIFNMTFSNVIKPSGMKFSLSNNKPDNKGASIKMQTNWKRMTQLQKNIMRKKYKDTDGDGVPNKWDCQPLNIMRQDWGTGSGMPIFTYPRSYGYRKRLTHMSPDDYMRLAKKGYRSEESRNMSDTEHEAHLSEKNINRLKPVIKSKHGKMTVPVLETKEGRIVDHEGRHRAMAAKALGHTSIPVYMVETHTGFIKSKEQRKPTKAMKWEQQDPDMDYIENEWEESKNAFNPDKVDQEDEDEVEHEVEYYSTINKCDRKKTVK